MWRQNNGCLFRERDESTLEDQPENFVESSMKKRNWLIWMISCVLFVVAVNLWPGQATAGDAGNEVYITLKNGASSPVKAELVDEYGRVFSANLAPGASQNFTLKDSSNIKVNGKVVYTVSQGDQKRVVTIGG